MNNDEIITFEDRSYVNPEVSMTEQDEFIEKFRNLQQQNQAQINQETYNLGTPVSSNLGGLTGAEGLWDVQYRRPVVNSAIENLRQVNLQQAVSTAMQNQQNAMANRLNQAKRAYYRAQQEAYNRGRNGGGTGGNNPDDANKGGINVEGLPEGKGLDTISSNAPGTSTVLTPAGLLGQTKDGRPSVGVYNEAGGKPLWTTNGEVQKQPSTAEEILQDVNLPISQVGLGIGGAATDFLNWFMDTAFSQEVKR